MDLESLITSTGINLDNASNSAIEAFTKDEYKEDTHVQRTAYVVCEKKSFRSDALFTMLEKEFKTSIIYTTETNNLPTFDNPLCFILDVTEIADNNLAQKIMVYIQDLAFENNIHVFVIGEPDELELAKTYLNRDNVAITWFKRPIDTKQCVDEITSILSTSPVVRRKKRIMVIDDSVTFLKLLKKR